MVLTLDKIDYVKVSAESLQVVLQNAEITINYVIWRKPMCATTVHTHALKHI